MKCNEFIPTANFKRSHDFLKHYKDSKELVSDEKPISIVDIGTSIRKYEINFSEHSSFYNFFDSASLVHDFLSNVKRKIKRSNEYFLIRCGFSLENIQPVLDNYNEKIQDIGVLIQLKLNLLMILCISMLGNQY